MTTLYAWIIKWSAFLIIGAIMIISFVVWLVWHDYEVGKNAAAPALAQSAVNAADSASAHDAVQTVSKNDQAAAKADDTTRKNSYVINNFPAAKTLVDPAVDAAIRSAICMRDSAANLPECKSVLQPSP